jgi:hypothetical protein
MYQFFCNLRLQGTSSQITGEIMRNRPNLIEPVAI